MILPNPLDERKCRPIWVIRSSRPDVDWRRVDDIVKLRPGFQPRMAPGFACSWLAKRGYRSRIRTARAHGRCSETGGTDIRRDRIPALPTVAILPACAMPLSLMLAILAALEMVALQRGILVKTLYIAQ